MPKGSKHGYKQSVVQTNTRKRKSTFKGTKKQDKKAQDQPEIRQVTEIAFVGDDDVVSEQVPPPQPSASAQKLHDVLEDLSSDDSLNAFEAEGESATGYRFVSMQSLLNFAKRLHANTTCDAGKFELKEMTTSRHGMCSSLFVHCHDCDMKEFLATGEHIGDATAPRTNNAKDINRRIVYASSEMGIGMEGVAKLCELLNMPFTMAINTWYKHQKLLHNVTREVAAEVLEANCKEAREAAMQELGSLESESMNVGIPVSFDGTWSKRGFTANHAVGFVISSTTGKVLDFEVLSKTCHACDIKKNTLPSDEFEVWVEAHECLGSFDGSSPSMEKECAKRLWGRSLSFDLMYKYMICDGDSKSYDSIWDQYGVCDTCNKFESMSRASTEYKEWLKSEDYVEWESSHLDGSADCNRVVKLDCIGHVQKRMGKALYHFQTSSNKLEDGKPVKGRSGRLTKNAIEKLKKYYGKAIRDNVNKNANTPIERDAAIAQMQNAIKASWYHCSKIPDKERHQFCPANSWCKYKKGLPCEDKDYHLDPVFIKCLEPIYTRLTDPALLARCLPGYTQNANESLNALVWARCPKHKWHGRERVEMAVGSAAIHFSLGATGKHEIMRRAGIEVGSDTEKESKRRDRERVEKAEKRASDQHRKYRQARSLARKRDEELRLEREGTTYEAGGFNELGHNLGPSTSHRRKKRAKKH
ncbi:uncharacterized protein LOC125563152 [Nematostella vectensis]|uniref:uncharacterized protein LOC125561097 n=1 Tax=Nematostella vectensis TaxID=45351 RepID=UPI0020774DC4|nr:uncharacterized protein LOC125561097 [Nematostella vectensis]XP_048584004.1 uncharacterized protein LOC125563152 [Nematostella vectensis]